MLDICASRENPLKINPLSLNVDPDIEEDVYSVQLFLP
jgi:hypothetical protein